MDPLETLLVFSRSEANRDYSYQWGWPDAFQAHPAFDCTPVNLVWEGWIRPRWRSRAHLALGDFDLIVLLHSTFSNNKNISDKHVRVLRDSDVPTFWFIGNESKLLPPKMEFAEELDVDVLVSQRSHEEVHRLYRERLGCETLWVSHAGFDPDVFEPLMPLDERPIDVGFRADPKTPYVGYQDRRRLAEFFQRNADKFDLHVDISLDIEDRFGYLEWARFLARCRGQLGFEAGTEFFELTDANRHRVNRYVDENPDWTFDEIHQRFFADYEDPVRSRVISSRISEAAATKTVQILFEGEYSGYLEPDEHYIPLKKDFSNVDEVLAKFRDDDYCRRVTENAHQLVHEELTYEKLIDGFRSDLETVLA